MRSTRSVSPPAAHRRTVLGSVLLFVGLGLLTLLLVDRELPLAMPRTWYTDRSLWVAGGLIALASGWYMLRDSNSEAGSLPGSPRDPVRRKRDAALWELGAAGPRFSRLVLYRRAGCHLCEEARATLEKYAAWLPPIWEVDIDGDPVLVEPGCICLLQPAVQGVGAQVTSHHQGRARLRREAAQPGAEHGVQRALADADRRVGPDPGELRRHLVGVG